MATANRVIKNTVYLYIKMGISILISLYTTRIILNSLGATDFGIFNIVGGAIALLGFLNGAMAGATQRFISYSEGEGNKEKQKIIFNVSILLHFFIAILIGFILLGAGYIFFNYLLNIPYDRINAAQIIYGSLIISTVFTVMSVPYDAMLNAHENMRYYALVGILESLLKLTTAVITVHTSYDKLIIYGILMACIPLISLIIMRIYCHKHYDECVIAPRKYWDKTVMKEISSFAGWNLLTSSSGILSQYGLGIIINSYFGVLLNAAQGIANQISGVLMTFSQNALKAINPIIVKSEGAGEKIKFIYTSLLGCRISYFLFGFFSIPFILKMPLILQLWLNQIPQWAIIFCQLQLLRILTEQLTISLGSAINAHGVIKKYNIYRSILYILPLFFVPLTFSIGAPPYWLYIIWILCWSILGGIISIYFSKKMVNISLKTYYKQVLFPCLIVTILSILFYIIITLILNKTLFHQIASIILESICYFILGWYLILQKKERTVIIQIFKNIISKNHE